ncbi:MAG: class I SAM-dependent methyltransferase [Patescibacteria group bacterium]
MGAGGGAFQRDIVFPGAARLLDPKPRSHILDIACGQGAFAQELARHYSVHVTGIDAAPSLIAAAKRTPSKTCTFGVSDARDFARLFAPNTFDGATCLLALQNIDEISAVFQNAAAVLKPEAPLVLVLNHPCFRQPRQSGWGWDEERKLQYRRVDRYLNAYEMPIEMHPGSAPRIKTYSYHRPLETYVRALADAGFMIDDMEEWPSNKTSDSGPRAKAENIAREEIPLFLALRGRLQG